MAILQLFIHTEGLKKQLTLSNVPYIMKFRTMSKYAKQSYMIYLSIVDLSREPELAILEGKIPRHD